MSKTTLSPAARALLDYIRTRDHVTFFEAATVLGQHVEVVGDQALRVPDYENLLLWTGLSRDAVDAMDELMEANLIHWKSADAMGFTVVLHPGQDKKATPVEVAP